MTDSQEHGEVNRNNSIDLNSLYDLNRCMGGKCVSNTISTASPIPTIEDFVYEPITNTSIAETLQPSADETAFRDSSPIMGDPSQMYQPITQAQSELYPTPAIVNEEIQKAEDQMQINRTTASDLFVPYEVTRESLQYLNGFIRTQIGRRVTIDFLVGSDTMQSRTGYLLAVAQNYLLLNELDTNDVTACDLYTMKFIRFYY